MFTSILNKLLQTLILRKIKVEAETDMTIEKEDNIKLESTIMDTSTAKASKPASADLRIDTSNQYFVEARPSTPINF